MIGPIIMLLVGLAFLPLSPLFGAMLIIASVVVLPFSRKMDADVAEKESEANARMAAVGLPPARDPANGCFAFALGAFGILVFVIALMMSAGVEF